MKFHVECIPCLMQGALKKAEASKDSAGKLRYMQRVCEVMSAVDPEYDSAPLLDARISAILFEELHIREDYSEAKRLYNSLILKLYDELLDQVRRANDPLYAALQLSMVGNYIDFGVLKDIEPEKVLQMLQEAAERELDKETYECFLSELATAHELVFLHDNCGEIVLDRLLLQVIHEHYPSLHLLSIVRAAPVLNDATMEDALEVGLDAICELTTNGAPGIAGTQLDLMPRALRKRLRDASIIIAKGQGNLETLVDAKLNIYHLLLSKCPHYTTWFGYPHLSGVFKRRGEQSNKANLD